MRLIDYFLANQDEDIEAPQYGQKLNSMYIGRPASHVSGPLGDHARELSDPAWRKWFDMVKARGVTKMGDASVGAKRGMFRPSVYGLLNMDAERSF